MKKIICVLSALVLILLFPVSALAAPAMFVDEAGLLRASDAAALERKLAALSEKYLCDTVVVTVDTVGESTQQEYIEHLYMNSDYGQGEDYKCLILLYVLDEDAWRISCWGEDTAFTNAGLNFISQRLGEDLADGGYAEAFINYAGWCERFYAQEAIIGIPYDENFLPPVDSAVPAVLARDPDALSLLADEAGLLSAAEAAALEGKLAALSDKWGMDVVVVTVGSTGAASPMEFADDWFDYGGYGQGASYDGLLLLIHTDRDPPGGWISTCGGAIYVFTDAGIQFIGKQIKADGLDSGDYAAALDSFAGWCDEFFAQAETGKPFDVGSLPKTAGDHARIVLLGLALGLVIAWFVTNGMKKKLKTVQKKQAAADYLRPGSLQVLYANEQFLYKNVTRVKQETSSSGGGGGSSTHTSSSGRSHGGGGF